MLEIYHKKQATAKIFIIEETTLSASLRKIKISRYEYYRLKNKNKIIQPACAMSCAICTDAPATRPADLLICEKVRPASDFVDLIAASYTVIWLTFCSSLPYLLVVTDVFLFLMLLNQKSSYEEKI
jgi:hypothetical protein